MTITEFTPERSVATLTMAELEEFIQTTVQKYTTPLVPPNSDWATPFDSSTPSLGAIATERANQIPDDVWQTVPIDASENIDTYLYQP